MLYLQDILFITKPNILPLELEAVSGYKINLARKNIVVPAKTSGEKIFKKFIEHN